MSLFTQLYHFFYWLFASVSYAPLRLEALLEQGTIYQLSSSNQFVNCTVEK